jgi:hypothetical protein
MVEWLEARAPHVDELGREKRPEFDAIRQEIGALRDEMRAGFAALDIKFVPRNAERMKWSPGVWMASFLGVVGALVALTRAPR